MPIGFSILDNQSRVRPQPGVRSIQSPTYPEAASSTFKMWEPLIISTSGGVDYVTQTIAKPATNDTVSASLAAGDLILGFAGRDASGTTGTPIPVILANQVDILTRLYNSTATSAEVQDVAIGDLTEPLRYRDSGADDVYMVVTPAPNGTDGINKFTIVERYSLEDGTDANNGEQSLTDTYALVWVRPRPTLTVFGR